MKKWAYLSTMLKNGRMSQFQATTVSKKDTSEAFLKCYSSISKKYTEIASNRENFKKMLIDDNYLFLCRYKGLVTLQLERHNMKEEISQLQVMLNQYEGLLNSFKY